MLVSIPNYFKVGDLFDYAHTQDYYRFEGMIVIQGGHYMYICRNQQRAWTLYDDVKVQRFGTWLEVIAMMEQSICYPKVLFFSKIDQSNPPEFESMQLTPIEILNYWNRELQSVGDFDRDILDELDD